MLKKYEFHISDFYRKQLEEFSKSFVNLTGINNKSGPDTLQSTATRNSIHSLFQSTHGAR